MLLGRKQDLLGVEQLVCPLYSVSSYIALQEALNARACLVGPRPYQARPWLHH